MSMEDDPEGPDYSLTDEDSKDAWLRVGGIALMVFLAALNFAFLLAVVMN